MSANLVVDLGNTCQMGVSIIGTPVLSGALVAPCSGAIIGMTVNMMNADTYCNLFVTGHTASGRLRVQVQTSDTDTSGNFTDPTSGIPAGSLPGAFLSGGILILNSGLTSGGAVDPNFYSGNAVGSGFFVAQGFIRNGTFVRANLLSGDFAAGPLTIGFISQLKTTGSGGGFTMLPSSGAVNV